MTFVALVLVVLICGCAGREVESDPRPISVSPGQPIVSLCPAEDCLCNEPPTAYEGVGGCCSRFPMGYAGSGPRHVVVLTDSPSQVHGWPGTLCGNLMALNGECPCTHGRYVETEMLAREFTVWPVCSGQSVRSAAALPRRRGLLDSGSASMRRMTPGRDGRMATGCSVTFRLRYGLDYWVRQDGRTEYVAADADTIDMRAQ